MVVAIVALATAGVSLSLRDAAVTQLEREAQRVAAMLESARAQSRALGVPLYWRPEARGFRVEGLVGVPANEQTSGPVEGAVNGAKNGSTSPAPGGRLHAWLTPGTLAQVLPSPSGTDSGSDRSGTPHLVLGPEPLLPPQRLTLSLQGRTVWLSSDGLRAFVVSGAPPDLAQPQGRPW